LNIDELLDKEGDYCMDLFLNNYKKKVSEI